MCRYRGWTTLVVMPTFAIAGPERAFGKGLQVSISLLS
jgi:hypothetical protein